MLKALKMFRKTMKVIVIIMSILWGTQAARAEGGDDSTPTAPVKHKTTSSTSSSSSSSSSTKALKREMASIREQFKSMIVEFSALQDRVTSIQSSLDELGASRRLQDLEKAISDLNGKSVSATNVTEETKTQVLDLSRKVKASAGCPRADARPDGPSPAASHSGQGP